MPLYCMIVLLVKFTLFVAFLIYLCLPFIWRIRTIIIPMSYFSRVAPCVVKIRSLTNSLNLTGSQC